MKKKIRKLLTRINLVEDSSESFSKVDEIIKNPKVKIISFVNQNAINIAYLDSRFFEIILNSELLFRDGIGVKIACIINKLKFGLNMNGTDFIPLILEKYKKKKIAIIGGDITVINKFYKKFSSDYNIILYLDGFKNFESYIKKINLTKPDILLLAMGMPKQEFLAKFIKDNYAHKLLIINGGAILDFMTGKIKRSPKIFSKLGLEWLVRLYFEPKRLFKRYVLGIPLYFYRIFKELI